MSTVNKCIIIAAIASRPYVQAAVAAGYDVVAMDAFADEEVRQLSVASYRLALHAGQLDGRQLLAVLARLDLSQCVGFCYGAGFERSADVLTQIQRYLPVLGNTASAIHTCKSPRDFFAQCDALAIPYPEVRDVMPATPQGWLTKEIGASGGAHIQRLTPPQMATDDACRYYQKEQKGRAISCLFVSGQQGVHIIGFNEQWLDADKAEPFRYGGAVSNPELRVKAVTQLTAYVEQLAHAMRLVGINSCDVICDGDAVYVLEINPRLSATMDLYADLPLMKMHLATCQQQWGAFIRMSSINKGSRAHQILYANQPFTLGAPIEWPDWVQDVPRVGESFHQGAPICTVFAQGETAPLAKQLVHERAAALSDTLLN